MQIYIAPDKQSAPGTATMLHTQTIADEANAMRATLEAIEERYIDGCDTYEDWKFMGDTARAFLSENAIGHVPGEKGTANE